MDTLTAHLRDADPLALEPRLSAADAAAIRRAVVAAADQHPSSAAMWPRPIFLAATVAITVVIGVALGAGLSRFDARDAASRGVAMRAPAPTSPAERRQLQFATPGGTRIIWVFDPEFHP